MIGKIHRVQRFPISIEEAWDFFSSPKNLKEITPDYMGFDIISEDLAERMYEGQIICYKVRPLFNLPLSWVTEITRVSKPGFFVDEQKVGPYSLWHHQHFFKKIEGGVEMVDLVNYSVGYGFLGKLADLLLVKGRLEDIFDFRYLKLEQLFGRYESSTQPVSKA